MASLSLTEIQELRILSWQTAEVQQQQQQQQQQQVQQQQQQQQQSTHHHDNNTVESPCPSVYDESEHDDDNHHDNDHHDDDDDNHDDDCSNCWTLFPRARAFLQRVLSTTSIDTTPLPNESNSSKRSGVWCDATECTTEKMPAQTQQAQDVTEATTSHSEEEDDEHYVEKDDNDDDAHSIKTDDDVAFLRDALRANVLFQHLTDAQLDPVVHSLQPIQVAAHETLPNDHQRLFYILQSGMIQFLDNDNDTRTILRRYDAPTSAWGDVELLYPNINGDSHNVVVQAVQDAVLWRTRVPWRRPPAVDLLEAEQDGDHGNNKMAKVTTKLTIQFCADQPLWKRGDAPGQLAYLIQQGTVRLEYHDFGVTCRVPLLLGPGEWISCDGCTSATAVTNVVVGATNLEAMKTTTMKQTQQKHQWQSLPLFAPSESSITDAELELLMEQLQERSFSVHETVLNGNARDLQQCGLWLIRQGHVRLRDGRTSHHLQAGDVFGDQWWRSGHSGNDDDDNNNDDNDSDGDEVQITCQEDSRFWVLSWEALTQVIGADWATRLGPSRPYQYQGLDETISLQDIEKQHFLGQGEFATVYLARDKRTHKEYALKTMSKLFLLEHQTNAIEATLHEKEIMTLIHHPFITGMIASFQDKEYIHLLLPLFPGGDLFGQIYPDDQSSYGISPDRAVFYSACIVEALGHLHSHSIVYRDLKPDNVMINTEGYAVLIDMGLAKFVTEQTFSMVGSPGYIASEIVLGQGYKHAVDYWALGCVIYEMLDGSTPFSWEGATQMEVFDSIVRGDFVCPDSFPSAARDLIGQLLDLDPKQRLGSGDCGHVNVRTHSWFDSIHFGQLRTLNLQSPWVPPIKDSTTSVSCMAPSDIEEMEPPYRNLTSKEQSLFVGF